MKTKNFTQLALYLILSITFMNCSLDETIYNYTTPSKVSFVNQTHTITEEMESISIPLKLDLKAINDGYVTIEFSGDATYGTDFTTVPQAENNKIRIKLLTNTQDTSFVVSRVNSLTIEKVIDLKLSNPTYGFSLGNRNTSEVKLNALPNQVNQLNFEASSGSISEGDSEGMVISLNTTTSVSSNGNVKINITTPEGIIYGTHFYTVPAAISNEIIQLEFYQNAQSTSFRIIPINDNLLLNDYTIVFELVEVYGSLVIGDNKSFAVNVLENEQTSGVVNTISELKSKFDEQQGDWYLTEDYLIEGVITSNGNTVDNKTVYIQDETSGILIHLTTPNIFNLGDKVRLNLKNSSGVNINGQKGMDQVNLNGYIKYAENISVIAETITLDQLHSGVYEGKRVKIEGVHFVEADGTVKFLGNHTINKDETGATVTVHPTAQFSDYVLPQGTISITGIVGDFGRLLPQKYTHDIIVN